MATKGSLGTGIELSETKPATRNAAGYQALKTRTITPSAFTDAEDSFTIPADDYATLIPGELVGLSAVGSITGLGVLAGSAGGNLLYNSDGTPAATARYCVLLGSNKIAFATSHAEALKGTGATKVALGGTLGAARIRSNNFKPCGEATSVGEFGREYTAVRTNNLKDGATRKAKGSFDQGSVQFDLLFDAGDVGQTLLEEAGDDTSTYVFRVALPGETGDKQEFYFEGLVMGLKRIVGGPNDAINIRTAIEIDHHSIIETTY